MKNKKYRVLRIAAIICFIFAIIEFGIGAFIFLSPLADENIEQIIIFSIAIVFVVEGIFFIIEGFLIYRAIKKGKTTLIIIFLLIEMFFQLITLINVAINSAYDFTSASDLISLIIKTVILKQIFEIRRLNME